MQAIDPDAGVLELLQEPDDFEQPSCLTPSGPSDKALCLSSVNRVRTFIQALPQENIHLITYLKHSSDMGH